MRKEILLVFVLATSITCNAFLGTFTYYVLNGKFTTACSYAE